MITFLVGGTVYTPDVAIEHGVVVVEDGKIVAASSHSSSCGEGERIDVTGLKVVPGLIDLHLHGCEGQDVLDDGGTAVAEKVVRSGVTSYLATYMAAPLKEMQAALSRLAIGRRLRGANLLGVHLEGPYISPLQAGMMNPLHFRPFDWTEAEELVRAGDGQVKMITIAPELEGAVAGIDRLERQGIITSVGHSQATFAEIRAAVEAGLHHATHVFNAMRGFHHREPGTVGAVLHFPEIVAQAIVDGQHLHPATVDLLLKAKGVANLALISDATPLAGLTPGDCLWQGTELEITEGRALVKSGGRLGGSIRMLNYGLRLLVESAGLPFTEALKMATTTPARVLGLEHQKGRLAPGWDADIAVFDDHYECRLAMVAGEIVYRSMPA